MSDNIRQIIESHHCFLEISPHCVECEHGDAQNAMSLRTFQAGFDVTIFGTKWSGDLDPPAEYWLVYTKLQELIDAVHRDESHGCNINVIPLGSNIVLDTRNDLQPFAMLRIRITHNRDVHEPADDAEQHAVKAVEAQLTILGIAACRHQT